MNNIKKLVIPTIGVLIAAFSFYFLAQNKSTMNVYAVYDPTKIGETSMIKATIGAFSSIKSGAIVSEIPNAKIEALKIDKNKTTFVVTAGQFGIDFSKSLIKEKKDIKILLCVHQWFDSMKDLHDVFLALPKHALNATITKWANKQNVQIITTQGVLHNVSSKSISTENTSAIRLKDAKVGIILGGDAEMPNGKDWKLFSEKNAYAFGMQVCKYLKKTGNKVLITNGPRTGAFKDPLNRDPNAHKDNKLDKISEVFLKTLTDAGFKQGENFEFFNFQFGKPSALKAIMAVVSKNKGFLLVPGESTSSISESIAVMQTVVYKVDSMNAIHKAYLNDLISCNTVILWPAVPELQESAYKSPEPQAVEVVKVLLSSVNKQ